MNKPLTELTHKDGERIFEFYFPGKTPLFDPKSYDYWFTEIRHESIVDEYGMRQISLSSGRPIIGIMGKGGLNCDNILLHFDDPKVMLWLYQNGFDIEEQLKENVGMFEDREALEHLVQGILQFSKGEDAFADTHKHNCTREFYINESKKLIEQYLSYGG